MIPKLKFTLLLFILFSLIYMLAGCAQYYPTKHIMVATPFTQAEFPDGAKIDTKIFPSEVIIK